MRASLAVVACCMMADATTQADEAFVTNQSGNDVSIVDLDSGATRAVVPVGGKPGRCRRLAGWSACLRRQPRVEDAQCH